MPIQQEGTQMWRSVESQKANQAETEQHPHGPSLLATLTVPPVWGRYGTNTVKPYCNLLTSRTSHPVDGELSSAQ